MLTNLYSPTPTLQPVLPLHVCNVGRFNSVGDFVSWEQTSNYSSSGWESNNRAIYTPMHMPAPFTIARFMIANNNTTGNADIGIYDGTGTRLLSTGTVAKNGAAGAVQYFDVTNTAFPAGHYYLGLAISTTSAAIFKTFLQDQYDCRMVGMLQEALGSTVLPSSMTPAAYASQLIFLYGFTQSDTL